MGGGGRKEVFKISFRDEEEKRKKKRDCEDLKLCAIGGGSERANKGEPCRLSNGDLSEKGRKVIGAFPLVSISSLFAWEEERKGGGTLSSKRTIGSSAQIGGEGEKSNNNNGGG